MTIYLHLLWLTLISDQTWIPNDILRLLTTPGDLVSAMSSPPRPPAIRVFVAFYAPRVNS
jgi:hypothetical protein